MQKIWYVNLLFLVIFAGHLLSTENTGSIIMPTSSTEISEETVEPVMTLKTMFKRIRETSPRILLERELVRRALQERFQERAELLPQLSLTASQIRQQFGLGFAGDQFDFAPFSSFGSRLELTQTLFDTERFADYHIARLEYAIAQMDYEIVYQDILNQAVNLYFTQLRDLNQKKIIEGNISRSEELLQLTNDRFAAGDGVEIDVTRAKARLAGDRRDLWTAKTNVQSSALQLKALLDMDLDAELKLNESLIERLDAPPELENYKIRGGKLIDLRPELAVQKKRLDQARLTRKAAKWQQIPSIELLGNWGYESNEVFDDNYAEVWLVGIQANMPIFEGLRIRAEKKNAAALLRQEEYQMQILEKEIDREFKTALFEMNSRYKEIELADMEIEFGRAEVTQAFLRYQEGLVDNRELIDAQQRLADAQDSYLNSAYLYALSRLAFARSIGAVEKVLD